MQLRIKSYVTGGYQDIEDYIHNLVQRLPFFGPLTMEVDMTMIETKNDMTGDAIRDNNKATELKDYFYKFILESLEAIGDPIVNDPNNFWFKIRTKEVDYADYLGSEENSKFDKIRYTLIIKKVS